MLWLPLKMFCLSLQVSISTVRLLVEQMEKQVARISARDPKLRTKMMIRLEETTLNGSLIELVHHHLLGQLEAC